MRQRLAHIKSHLLAEDTVHKQGEKVIRQLEEHPWFQCAHRILMFHSLPDEINTHELINRYKDVKTILLPTVVDCHLELHVHNSASPTAIGAFNIVESLGELVPQTEYSSIDLAVIPGVAFDKAGNRLGRGKGYYDRLLPLLDCHTIGICFPFQFVEAVPHEPHDIRVDDVIY